MEPPTHPSGYFLRKRKRNSTSESEFAAKVPKISSDVLDDSASREKEGKRRGKGRGRGKEKMRGKGRGRGRGKGRRGKGRGRGNGRDGVERGNKQAEDEMEKGEIKADDGGRYPIPLPLTAPLPFPFTRRDIGTGVVFTMEGIVRPSVGCLKFSIRLQKVHGSSPMPIYMNFRVSLHRGGFWDQLLWADNLGGSCYDNTEFCEVYIPLAALAQCKHQVELDVENSY